MDTERKAESGSPCCGGSRRETADARVVPRDAAGVRDVVRRRYAETARAGSSPCCAGPQHYTPEELAAIPSGANLGLGSGNPVAAADLRPGERVLDLGCGAGVDAFLAAQRVSPGGSVVGVDMTPEMIERARRNAASSGVTNVEFREGLIEAPPVEDASVDVVISNCVISLSPDKDAVFQAACAALRPGGRLVVSDLALDREPSPALRADAGAYCGCIAGADTLDVVLDRVRRAGFESVEVISRSGDEPIPGETARVSSLLIRARRPAR
jgi:SAM-dependent methyltransferase